MAVGPAAAPATAGAPKPGTPPLRRKHRRTKAQGLLTLHHRHRRGSHRPAAPLGSTPPPCAARRQARLSLSWWTFRGLCHCCTTCYGGTHGLIIQALIVVPSCAHRGDRRGGHASGKSLAKHAPAAPQPPPGRLLAASEGQLGILLPSLDFLLAGLWFARKLCGGSFCLHRS